MNIRYLALVFWLVYALLDCRLPHPTRAVGGLVAAEAAVADSGAGVAAGVVGSQGAEAAGAASVAAVVGAAAMEVGSPFRMLLERLLLWGTHMLSHSCFRHFSDLTSGPLLLYFWSGYSFHSYCQKACCCNC